MDRQGKGRRMWRGAIFAAAAYPLVLAFMAWRFTDGLGPVSYTHLTLPTN